MEEIAEALFALPQRLLRPLPVGDVGDAAPDQAPVPGGEPHEPHLGLDLPAVPGQVHPLEDRALPVQGPLQELVGLLHRRPPVGLDRGAELIGDGLPELLLRPPVELDGVAVELHDPAFVHVHHHDRLRGVLDEGLEPLFGLPALGHVPDVHRQAPRRRKGPDLEPRVERLGPGRVRDGAASLHGVPELPEFGILRSLARERFHEASPHPFARIVAEALQVALGGGVEIGEAPLPVHMEEGVGEVLHDIGGREGDSDASPVVARTVPGG